MQEHTHNESEKQQAKDAEKVAIPQHQVNKTREPNQPSADRDNQWEKRFATYSLVFDGLVAFSALIGTAAAIVGGYLIWEQIGLTRESNRLTGAALCESKRQFDLQRKDADAAAREERDRFTAILRQQQQATAAEQELMRQSLIEARRSLEISRRSVQETLRARITITGAEVDFGVTPPVFYANVVNRGGIPAEKVARQIDYIIGSGGQRRTIKPVEVQNALAPGADYSLITKLTLDDDAPVVIRESYPQSVRDGKFRLRIWVILKYGDAFVPLYPPHEECFEYDPVVKMLGICDQGNKP